MKNTIFTLFAAVCILFTTISASTDQGLRRFALAIGSDYGGKGRDTLLYAASDANNFRKVLVEMGGVNASDFLMLSNPDPRRLEAALVELKRKVKNARSTGGRTEVVLYYSGHADNQGLLLGDSRYEYSKFRQQIDSISADVRIAILDACASGAITRLKGGKTRPAFTVDVSSDMRGYAFLTSSSAEEASQESDRIGSSFFTHSLVSGLRGAADVSGDGKVTLGEAYQFAFHETLARTERTKGGPQHPAYDMKLSGTGDVVMTDMRETTAAIVLDSQLEGRLFVRNTEGQLVAELYKPAGRPMELGLTPGEYSILLEKPATSALASVNLTEGNRENLGDAKFRKVAREKTVSRGDAASTDDTSSASGLRLDLNDQIDVPTGLPEDFTVSLGFFLNRQSKPFHGLQLAIFLPYATDFIKGGQISAMGNYAGKHLQGFQAAAIGNMLLGSVEGVQAAGTFNIAGGKVSGGQGAGTFNFCKSVDGGQGAGVMNMVAEDFDGGQGAGVVNFVGGTFKGIQAAGVLNTVGGSFSGGQGAGVLNVVGDSLRGGQGAGVANVVVGKLSGGQGAGVLNYSHGFNGAQFAGVSNLSIGDSRGTQMAGVFNLTRNITGLQAAGVVNVARDVKGCQIGLVNISRDIQGGIPIGLINYSHTGLHSINFWADESGYLHTTLMSGSRNFYTSFSIGARPQYSPLTEALGVGAGIQIPINSWFAAADVNAYTFLTNWEWPDAHDDVAGSPELYRLRLLAGREVLPYVSLFGGVSANYLWNHSGRKSAFPWGDYQREVDEDHYVWPGFFAGLRIGQ